MSVDTGDYLILEHALVEADKDGVSQDQIEGVMAVGMVRRREPQGAGGVRYVLARKDLTIVVAVDGESITVITVWRERDA